MNEFTIYYSPVIKGFTAEPAGTAVDLRITFDAPEAPYVIISLDADTGANFTVKAVASRLEAFHAQVMDQAPGRVTQMIEVA
jgi:hypothetical protein